MDHITNIVSAINSYYTRLLNMEIQDDHVIAYKEKLDKYSDKLESFESEFHKIHTIKKIEYYVGKIYSAMNIEKLKIFSDISSTKMNDINVQYNNLTRIFKIYMVDFAKAYKYAVNNSFNKVKNNTSKSWQVEFHKYLYSVDLYNMCMNHAYKTYKSTDDLDALYAFTALRDLDVS